MYIKIKTPMIYNFSLDKRATTKQRENNNKTKQNKKRICVALYPQISTQISQ